ncbi:winged helix-turn-helix transcriptional regulator [Patescibacteria group bacterium]|nr:winged helix-turn-helix transcriptional regulator [Patescibacteria group bacterium]
MTSNEKKVLVKFREIKEGNTVTMAGTLRVTIGYACDVCKKLCEKGYLERLSPGRFALYKITPLGEEQVKGEGEIEKELTDAVGTGEGDKEEVEEMGEYECTNCGAAVKERDIECPKCGTVFEEGVEEEATEGGTTEGQSDVDKKTEISDQPSVPEDWKTCNWKWK